MRFCDIKRALKASTTGLHDTHSAVDFDVDESDDNSDTSDLDEECPLGCITVMDVPQDRAFAISTQIDLEHRDLSELLADEAPVVQVALKSAKVDAGLGKSNEVKDDTYIAPTWDLS